MASFLQTLGQIGKSALMGVLPKAKEEAMSLFRKGIESRSFKPKRVLGEIGSSLGRLGGEFIKGVTAPILGGKGSDFGLSGAVQRALKPALASPVTAGQKEVLAQNVSKIAQAVKPKPVYSYAPPNMSNA